MNDEEKKQVKSRDILNIITENVNGNYWHLIRNELMEWLRTEESYLNQYKSIKMSDNLVEDFNLQREKIKLITRFLNINEDLIKRHCTIIERIQRYLDGKKMIDRFIKLQSFVSSNGK